MAVDSLGGRVLHLLAARIFGGYTLNNNKLPYLHFPSDTNFIVLSQIEKLPCFHGIRNFITTCTKVHIKVYPVPK